MACWNGDTLLTPADMAAPDTGALRITTKVYNLPPICTEPHTVIFVAKLACGSLVRVALIWSNGSVVYAIGAGAPIIWSRYEQQHREHYPPVQMEPDGKTLWTVYHSTQIFGERMVTVNTMTGAQGISLHLTSPTERHFIKGQIHCLGFDGHGKLFIAHRAVQGGALGLSVVSQRGRYITRLHSLEVASCDRFKLVSTADDSCVCFWQRHNVIYALGFQAGVPLTAIELTLVRRGELMEHVLPDQRLVTRQRARGGKMKFFRSKRRLCRELLPMNPAMIRWQSLAQRLRQYGVLVAAHTLMGVAQRLSSKEPRSISTRRTRTTRQLPHIPPELWRFIIELTAY